MEGSTAHKSAVDLKRFARLRKDVLGELSRIAELALVLGSAKVAEQLEEVSRQLEEECFRLVVIGEFSNGKSTLINALLGDRVLPSSTSPTTAVLTLIEKGDEPQYFLKLRDGHQKKLTKEEFRELVAPPEADPSDLSDVARFNEKVSELSTVNLALIQYPTQLCTEGVQIVDTPGTNDLDAVRERITYEFVPKADAVVFVLSARQILSSKEMDFLKGRILKADIGRLFFAINFKDFLDSPEKQLKILNYAEQHLRQVVDSPRIFLVCARDALIHRAGTKSMGTPLTLEETGVPHLEEALSEFLESSRSATKLERPILVGTRLASDLIEGPLNLRRSAIGLGVHELRAKIAALEPELNRARNEHREVLEGLRAQLEEEGEKIQSELKRGLESVVSLGINTARDYQGDLTPERIAEAVEKVVGVKHTEQVERAKNCQSDALKDHCKRAEKRMQAAWSNVKVKVDSEFKGTISGQALSLPSVISDDEIGKISLGGGIGTLAIVALAHIAFPIAIIGGIIAFFGLGGLLEAERRKKILDEVVPQIRQRLADGIPPTLEAFQSEWNRASASACNSFDQAYTTRIDSFQSQLRLLAENQKGEERKASAEREECDMIQADIERSINTLRGCRWEQ